MSSTTSRAAFYKPAGGENINVTTDLNNNWDKLDTNLNWRVVANAAARNAITPFWAGLGVRETDTGRLYVSNGTAPISASWSEVVQADNTTVGQMLFGNLIRNTRATAGDSGYETRVTGDSFARWYVQADGKQWWSPGNATFDTNLYRASANLLKTDDAFQAVGNLTVGGSAVVTGDIQTNGDLVMGSGTTKFRNSLSATTTVANTATETVIASQTIPANDMVAGAVYKITAWGTVNTVATPPTLNIKAKIGGLAGSQFAQTGGVALNASNTTRVFKVEVYLVCLTTGASGTVFGNLDVWNGAATGTPGTANPTNFQNTTAVSSSHIMDGGTTSTVDTTASKDLVLTATWASSNAASLIVRGYASERVA